jgi:hypothetical protein
VRKTELLGLILAAAFSPPAGAGEAARQKIARYFEGWYPYRPGTQVTATPTREVALAGLETYRVERRSASNTRQESNVSFYDHARDELFVGDVLHDPARSGARRRLEPARDLPPLQASLSEAFGVPVAITLEGDARGALRPIRIAMREEKDVVAVRRGFLSEDGATALLGEFHPASGSAAEFRERLLKERPGIRTGPGRFSVTEFLDFECPRCRRRTPEVRRTVEASGGAVEVRLLPLVQQHPGSFAVAELGAALAEVDPALYRKYEEALFGRGDATPAAARELASDVSESANARERFEAALAQGKGRERVVRDVELAMRLGVSGTPSFVSRGVAVPGERWVVEGYLWQTGQIARRPEASE